MWPLRRDLTLLEFLPQEKAMSGLLLSRLAIHSSDPSAGDKHENFCRTKMMLHHFSTNVHD